MTEDTFVNDLDEAQARLRPAAEAGDPEAAISAGCWSCVVLAVNAFRALEAAGDAVYLFESGFVHSGGTAARAFTWTDISVLRKVTADRTSTTYTLQRSSQRYLPGRHRLDERRGRHVLHDGVRPRREPVQLARCLGVGGARVQSGAQDERTDGRADRQVACSHVQPRGGALPVGGCTYRLHGNSFDRTIRPPAAACPGGGRGDRG